MKKFLVLYRADVAARNQMAEATPDQVKAGMDLWMAWAGENQSVIVDMGSPVGNSVAFSASGPAPADERIGGYGIVQGESLEEVSKRFAKHPHFHTPGNSEIQILELISLPGM